MIQCYNDLMLQLFNNLMIEAIEIMKIMSNAKKQAMVKTKIIIALNHYSINAFSLNSRIINNDI